MRLDLDTAHDFSRPFITFNLLTRREDFSADVNFWAPSGLLATEFTLSGMRVERNPSKISAFDTETIVVEQYTSGFTRGVLEDTRTGVSKGVVHIMDWSRPYKAVLKSASGMTLHIPHARIGYDPSRHHGYRALPTHSAMGCLLSTAVHRLISELHGGPSSEADELVVAILGLVRTCLTADESWLRDPQYDEGRRRLIESYIAQNLGRRDLGTDHICRALGLSRATLYRCLDGKGVNRAIQDARLDRCFSSLLHAEPGRGAVGKVAKAWGFEDASGFRKSFRRKFGFSPSDCVWEGDPQIRDHFVMSHPVLQTLHKS